MKIQTINHTSVRYQYRGSYATYQAYKELERYYGPYELFEKLVHFIDPAMNSRVILEKEYTIILII